MPHKWISDTLRYRGRKSNPQINLSPLRNYEWRNMLRVNISQSTVFQAFCVVLQGSMILDAQQ